MKLNSTIIKTLVILILPINLSFLNAESQWSFGLHLPNLSAGIQVQDEPEEGEICLAQEDHYGPTVVRTETCYPAQESWYHPIPCLQPIQTRFCATAPWRVKEKKVYHVRENFPRKTFRKQTRYNNGREIITRVETNEGFFEDDDYSSAYEEERRRLAYKRAQIARQEREHERRRRIAEQRECIAHQTRQEEEHRRRLAEERERIARQEREYERYRRLAEEKSRREENERRIKAEREAFERYKQAREAERRERQARYEREQEAQRRRLAEAREAENRRRIEKERKRLARLKKREDERAAMHDQEMCSIYDNPNG